MVPTHLLFIIYIYIYIFQFTKLDAQSTTSSISSGERGIYLHLNVQDSLLRMFFFFFSFFVVFRGCVVIRNCTRPMTGIREVPSVDAHGSQISSTWF
jgi:hypothetical protein